MTLYQLGEHTVVRVRERALHTNKLSVTVMWPGSASGAVGAHMDRISKHNITGRSANNVNDYNWSQK